jgi:hypothetical protein
MNKAIILLREDSKMTPRHGDLGTEMKNIVVRAFFLLAHIEE